MSKITKLTKLEEDPWTYEIRVEGVTEEEYTPGIVIADNEIASTVDARSTRVIHVPDAPNMLPGCEMYVSEYPETMERYLQFCHATGHRIPSSEGWGYRNQPVINVSEMDIVCYINWLNELYGYSFRFNITYNENGEPVEFEIGDLTDPVTGEPYTGFMLPDDKQFVAYVADAAEMPNKEEVFVHSGNSNSRAQPVDFAKDPVTGEEKSRNKLGIPAALGNVWVVTLLEQYMNPYYERAKKNYSKHKKGN